MSTAIASAPARLIRLPEVILRTGISRSHIHKLIAEGLGGFQREVQHPAQAKRISTRLPSAFVTASIGVR